MGRQHEIRLSCQHGLRTACESEKVHPDYQEDKGKFTNVFGRSGIPLQSQNGNSDNAASSCQGLHPVGRGPLRWSSSRWAQGCGAAAGMVIDSDEPTASAVFAWVAWVANLAEFHCMG